MSDYNITAVTRRKVYSGSAGTGPYAFTFPVISQTDLAVYKNSTKLTLTTDYTVAISSTNGTGSVTLISAATSSDQITIVGSRTIQRTTDFVTAGDLSAASLNEQLDGQIIMIQQIAEENKRTLKAPVYDLESVEDGGVLNMVLPTSSSRAGKVMAFDESGNPVNGPTINSVQTVANASASINTVAGSITNVNTVAGNITNVNTVAGVSSAVSTIASNISNVNTVASDLNEPVSEINTVAVSIANVDTVGTNITNVNTVAGISANVTTVAGNSSNVTTVAGSISNVNTAATNIASINTAASNITAIQNASTNASTATTKAAEAAASAVSAASAQTAAESARDATLASFDSFDDRYLGAKTSDPTLDNDGNALLAGSLYFNSASGVMKVYTGSTWVAAYVSGTDFLPLVGGTLTGSLGITGNLTFSGTARRITGDMSNSTIANRVIFQTSTANATTNITVIPNGTATQSNLQLYNGTDPANAGLLSVSCSSSEVRFNSTIFGTGTYLPMTFITGGSERARIDTSGNVGIGVTPSYKFQVQGTAAAGPVWSAVGNTDATAGSSAGFLGYASGTNNYFTLAQYVGGITALTNAGAGSFTISNVQAVPLIFATTATERMRIASTGLVSVGRTGGFTGSETFTANGFSTFGSDTAPQVIIGNTGTGYGVVGTYSNYPVEFRTNNTGRMYIDTSGLVGVGTSAPTAGNQMEIKAATGIGASLILTSTDATANAQAIMKGSRQYQIGTGNASSGFAGVFYIYDATASATRAIIDSNGNLQIGGTTVGNTTGYVNSRTNARAWVNFNGTLTGTITPRGNYNVSSVTKNATGDYTLNFTTALADANYSAVISTSGGATNGITGAVKASAYNGTLTNMTTTSLSVYAYNANSNFDVTLMSVIIFGN